MNSRTLTWLCQVPGTNPRQATSHFSLAGSRMTDMFVSFYAC